MDASISNALNKSQSQHLQVPLQNKLLQASLVKSLNFSSQSFGKLTSLDFILDQRSNQCLKNAVLSELPRKWLNTSGLNEKYYEKFQRRPNKKVESRKHEKLNNLIAELKYEFELFKWQSIRMFQEFHHQCIKNMIQLERKSQEQNLQLQQQKDQKIALLEDKNKSINAKLDSLIKKLRKNESKIFPRQKIEERISQNGASQKLLKEKKISCSATASGSLIEYGMGKSCFSVKNPVKRKPSFLEKQHLKKYSFCSEKNELNEKIHENKNIEDTCIKVNEKINIEQLKLSFTAYKS